jgi:hypothetical protein
MEYIKGGYCHRSAGSRPWFYHFCCLLAREVKMPWRVSEAPCIFCPGTIPDSMKCVGVEVEAVDMDMDFGRWWSTFPAHRLHCIELINLSFPCHNVSSLQLAMKLSTFSIITKAVACSLLMLALAVTMTHVVNGEKIFIVEWLFHLICLLYVYRLLFVWYTP